MDKTYFSLSPKLMHDHLDRTIFWASPAAYAEFLAILDSPPKPNDRLMKTMQTITPWELRP